MGHEKRIEVEVSTWRFTTAIELESDVWWQRAPLLEVVRDRLVRRLSEAWKVRYLGVQVATLIEFQPILANSPVVISTYSGVLYGGSYLNDEKPGPVTMHWPQRLMLLQDNTVMVVPCTLRRRLWERLATPLAKPIGEHAIREEQTLARIKLGMTLEDCEALKDL